MPIDTQSCDHHTRLVNGPRSRVYAHHNTLHLWCMDYPTGLEDISRPQGAWHVLKDMGMQFLTSEPCPLIALDDMSDKPCGEIRDILVGITDRQHHPAIRLLGLCDQLFNEWNRPRCGGGHDLWLSPKA